MPLNKIHPLQHRRIRKDLESVCDRYKVRISRDVRITDLIPAADIHLSRGDFRFLLHSKYSHGVISREGAPLFLVDFSNPIHYREKCRRNDDVLDSLCRDTRLPLLRINADHLEADLQQLHLICLFIEIRLTGKRSPGGNHQAQGGLPKRAVSLLPGGYEALWGPSELRLKNSCRKTGKKLRVAPLFFLGADRKMILHGIGWSEVSRESGIIAHATLRNHGFPVSERGLLTGILRFQIFEKLFAVYGGTTRPVPMETIEKSVRFFKERLAPLPLLSDVSRNPARKKPPSFRDFP